MFDTMSKHSPPDTVKRMSMRCDGTYAPSRMPGRPFNPSARVWFIRTLFGMGLVRARRLRQSRQLPTGTVRHRLGDSPETIALATRG